MPEDKKDLAAAIDAAVERANSEVKDADALRLVLRYLRLAKESIN